jgi:hypothetical protein
VPFGCVVVVVGYRLHCMECDQSMPMCLWGNLVSMEPHDPIDQGWRAGAARGRVPAASALCAHRMGMHGWPVARHVALLVRSVRVMC